MPSHRLARVITAPVFHDPRGDVVHRYQWLGDCGAFDEDACSSYQICGGNF